MVSQSNYGDESFDQVNFYGQSEPRPEAAPIDFVGPGPSRDSVSGHPEPTLADPGAGDPGSYLNYTQPGVGYSVPTTYNTVAPYTPTTGYYYHHLPEHPSATPTLVWGLLGLFVLPPLAYVALAVGSRARREVQLAPERYANSGQLTAGWVLGIIGSVLCSLYILMGFFVVALVFLL